MQPDANKDIPGLQPAIIVIFGITGDLAKRYLLPSLYHLFKQGLLHEKTEIVGISRRQVYLDDLFNKVEMCVSEDDNICDPVVMARMHSHTRVHQLDMDDTEAFRGLLQLLNDIEAEQAVCMNRLYYLSIPPSAYRHVLQNMGAAGLNASCPHGTAMTRLLAEKPFGHDYRSAQELAAHTAEIFGEEQIFRIDHYLAKETAQNIMAFRFQNPLFEALWDNQHINAIDIVASEKIGIEGRAEFYEQQGALCDFAQNHLIQLLAITIMDEPTANTSQAIHDAKLQLLQAIQPVNDVTANAWRGQYEGYRQEVGNEQSHVETYAAIRLQIDSARWQGVPITIRTGKAMAERFTEITVSFAAHSTIDGQAPSSSHNILRFRIQPNEGIQLGLLAKKPGYSQELQPVTMDFSYQHSFEGGEPTAYERVLIDAVRGDRSLFASSDEILAAWRIVDPIVQAWQADSDGLQSYPPGTNIEELTH